MSKDAPRNSVLFDRYLDLLDCAPGFIVVVSGPDHVFEFANQAYVQLAGHRELIGRTMRSAFPELGADYFEVLDKVYTTGERARIEGLSLCLQPGPDEEAEERFLDFIHEPMLDAEGEVAGIILSGHDVTAANLAKQNLKTIQKRQAALIELSDRLRDVDDPTDISFAAAELLGKTLGISRAGYGTIDPVAETITIDRDWNAPGIRSLAGVVSFREYGEYIENLKRGEAVVYADAEKDPRVRNLAARLKKISAQAVVNLPLREQGGLVAFLYLNNATPREWPPDEMEFIGEVAERTRMAVERRRAERHLTDLAAELEKQVGERTAALSASEARVRTILETSYQYQGLLTLEGVLLEVNAAALTAIEESAEDVVGRRFWETPWFTTTPGMSELVREAVGRAAAGEAVRQDICVNLPTIGWRWLDFTMRPQFNAEGQVIALVPEGVDITERRQAEEALRQSQKLESMGQLTGGVAHDFNNLLTPIIGGLDMLQRRGAGSEREQRLVEGALASAERAKTLVQRLLAFARRQPLQPTPVDVAALVRGMADLVASTTGPRIKVSVDVAPDLPSARSDPHQLEMAILNLSVNARDAMPDGGVLRISAMPETIEPGHRSGLPVGRYVRLGVSDTGVGMDEAVMARAIEPFFSTKGVGKGTGLGLSMVHGLVTQLGGALALASRPGHGTTVELWLPTSSQTPHAPSIAAAPARPPSAGVALLVDDEDFVRMSTAEMLRELGYEVVEACSGEDALEVLDHRPVDLLVTDHLMPGMTGVDLARKLRSQRAETPILIISGFAEGEGLAPDIPRLAKPFRQGELAAIIGALQPG